MVVQSIIVCPICGKRTYLRIQNGGYLYEYPIRVYCFNCHALMKGAFVMTSSAGPFGLLKMFNAKVETIYPEVGAEREIDADYIAEVSGELPCNRTVLCDGKLPSVSPFFRAADQIDILARKEQLREFYTKMEEWAQWRSIAFQLLIDDEIERVPTALRNKMGTYAYECSGDYLKALHCLQEIVCEETISLFASPSQIEIKKELIKTLSCIDRQQLHLFVERIGGVNAVITAYKKTIEAFFSFMQVYQNLLPAETYQSFKKKNDSSVMLSTCTFSDIKGFYQDAYEILLSIMHIPVCIDNILMRGSYLQYHSAYSNFFDSNSYIRRPASSQDDYVRYTYLDNGKKAELMTQASEQVQRIINVPVNKNLRNAISHNTYKYDGPHQVITVYDQKSTSRVSMRISLLDLSIDCLGLAKSIVLFGEILLFILRSEEKEHHSIIHPRYYINLGRNDPCPCGSGKKYKNCCIRDIEKIENKYLNN